LQKFEDLPKNNGQTSLYSVADSVGIVQNRSKFIPGRFYSLTVSADSPNLTEDVVPLLNDRKPYLDINPCGFCIYHDNWQTTALILNLKVIPNRINQRLLEAFYEFAKLNGLSDLFDRDGTLIPLAQRLLLDKRFYMIPPKILSQLVGATNLNYAINKYSIDQIIEARLIDWDQYGMLVNPLVEYRGIYPQPANLSRIYEDFIANSFE